MDKKIVCLLSLIIGLALFTTKSFDYHEITYFRDNKKGAVSITLQFCKSGKSQLLELQFHSVFKYLLIASPS
jgi:hypothetical protein